MTPPHKSAEKADMSKIADFVLFYHGQRCQIKFVNVLCFLCCVVFLSTPRVSVVMEW